MSAEIKTRSTQDYPAEALRRSVLLLAALLGTGLSAYFMATLPGLSQERIIMTILSGGWFSMIVHTVRR